ncbi:MAG: hypothetical protein U1C55_00365 [Smithellaceae bacterium]|nr:hypothetical protein [Smithellaceae bacterium]
MNHEGKADGKAALFLGIRAKMLLFFGVGAALILLSVSLINLFGVPFAGIKGSYQAHRSEIIKRMDEIADLKKGEIHRLFEERINHVRAFAEEHSLDTVIARFGSGMARGEKARRSWPESGGFRNTGRPPDTFIPC